MPASIDQLIVNSPYAEPERYWRYDRETQLFDLVEGERRPAGYVRATEGSKSFDDPGEFVELPLVSRIRPRVREWADRDYPGTTSITRRLLAHWRDPEQREGLRFFFCQLEAVETLIWLVEAPQAERQGIEIPSDGGDFTRLCSKMATGSGKTIVMAMLIAWQVLNKATTPNDPRFSKNFLVVAPSLTVKSRLQVLQPAGEGNYYDEFNVVPSGLRDKLRQGRVLIRNWHALMDLDPDDGPKVVKKGLESDEAYARRVLEDMSSARNIAVINDEAHHAWRDAGKSSIKGLKKEEREEALWVAGLDRLHRCRGILRCFDLTATPLAPTGEQSRKEALFGWVVSDFSLNDAIESGLVKTPRVVVRDDGELSKDYKSRLYHIFRDKDVGQDLNRRAGENEPLPDLVNNGYYLLGKDWLDAAERWEAAGVGVPPVMISVCNRVETSARVYNAFVQNKIHIERLADPERTLRIDTKVLKDAEQREQAIEIHAPADDEDNGGPVKLSKQEQAERLRRQVDTVGRPGEPGEQIQNVISVGMLSEGWDTKNVTHIMGLRAFSSQLLCEQVVGRGLRRTSYEVNPETGLFEPEYVNIFGVPFTFLPHEGGDDAPPSPPDPKTRVEPVPDKEEFELRWPNVLRVEHEYRPRLELDLAQVEVLDLDMHETATAAEIAPIIDGKPDLKSVSEIDLQDLAREYRMQKVVFESARDVYEQMRPSWKGNKQFLIAQLIPLIERLLASDRVRIHPELFARDELKRRLVLTMNMTRVVQHIWEAIRFENTESLAPVFDPERPIRSTGDMRTWFTSKPSQLAAKSHINRCVQDSGWEGQAAYDLDHHSGVEAWVKNEHLGLEVLYTYRGAVNRYIPDFIIRLANETMLVLEVKGEDSEKNRTKRRFLDEWIRAVNSHRGFGHWEWDVSFEPSELPDVLQRHLA